MGWVLGAPTDVVLSPHDIVQPDLVFIARRRQEAMTPANIQGPPDLAVEVLSPSRPHYDLKTKLFRYEELGVGEYWIIDADKMVVQVFRRNAQRRFEPVQLAGAMVTSPLLPGFALSVPELFANLGV